LGEVAEFFDEQRIPIESGLRKRGPYPYYGATGIVDFVDGYIFDGEYILLAEDGANIIDRSSPLAYLATGRFWLNNHAHIMKIIDGSNRYLLQVLERHNYSALNSGTAQPKLNAKSVKSMILSWPGSREQTRIGVFFRTLDDLIAANERKCELLRQLKRGYLQQLFPAPGCATPRLRFRGFASAWIKRKLGDVAGIVGGGTPDTSIPGFWDGDIDWYTPAEIGEDVYVSGSQRKITEDGLRNSSAKILPPDTILFTSRAGIGKIAILSKEAATNQGFQSIIPGDKLNSYFLFSQSESLKHYGEMMGAGSTFVEVSGKQMAQMPIALPDWTEQSQISSFFRALDNLIAANEHKVEQLHQLKRAYLQTMFV
jgi:type I restriction enzyme S subunit